MAASLLLRAAVWALDRWEASLSADILKRTWRAEVWWAVFRVFDGLHTLVEPRRDLSRFPLPRGVDGQARWA